eukprot:364720-Chlamydomonas_euryale.AAC.5
MNCHPAGPRALPKTPPTPFLQARQPMERGGGGALTPGMHTGPSQIDPRTSPRVDPERQPSDRSGDTRSIRCGPRIDPTGVSADQARISVRTSLTT